jgi:hypothetical protein
MDAVTTVLLAQVDRAYDRHSWHGTNLRGSLRRVTPENAVWRPHPSRHNIQEVTVHCAYWKYAVTRRITGEKRGAFPLTGSNWFPREGADAGLWAADLRLLDECHRRLRAAVATLDARGLARRSGAETFVGLVAGVIAHDLYHAGQIQLLKRLSR